jgi:hypothetical protein
MARSIVLEAARFFAFLEASGFTRLTNSGREVVYGRAHHKAPHLLVKVYTSCSDGELESRSAGKDAIRVVAVVQGGKGLWKGPRVYRTGSQEAVQMRTLERMREAYAHLNKVAKWQTP